MISWPAANGIRWVNPSIATVSPSCTWRSTASDRLRSGGMAFGPSFGESSLLTDICSILGGIPPNKSQKLPNMTERFVFYRKLHQALPRIVRGEGVYLFDDAGKRYL